MRNIFVSLLTLIISITATAQTVSHTQAADSMLFRHLSVGASIGDTGLGVEVATTITPHLSLRAGVQLLALGTAKVELPFTNNDIYKYLDISDPTMSEAARKHKAQLGVNATIFTGNILADYYLHTDKAFHITAGFYFGNRTVMHLFNRTEGEMKFLNIANENIQTYNQLFDANFPKAGLQFGDYTFTADNNGNIDAKIQTWSIRPYIGVGWGHLVSMTHKRKVNLNFDCGAQFWGTPQCRLNNEKTISTGSDRDGGVLQSISQFTIMPTLKVVISGDIF